MSDQKRCPVTGATAGAPAGRGKANRDWWPSQVNFKVLHQHAQVSNPMDRGFNCAEEFKQESKT